MLVADCVPKASSIKDIQAATKKDAVLQKVITGVLTDKWELDDQTKKFYNIRESLSTKNGILLKGTRIVIPQQLQNNTLQLAHHTQHQGVEKTRALLREKVWWPSMNAEVEEKVKNCHACQVTKPQDLKCQPLKMSEIPKTSWHTLAMDIQGPYPGGDYILLMVDYRSRYPIAVIQKSITSESIIKSISKTFTEFGYPQRITTDNGSQFISQEFGDYLKSHGIEHRRVTPYWPAANGEVERMNRTMKRAVQCAVVEGKRWQTAIHEFLLGYRTTPHSTTGVAPSKLLFKHELRNDIPFVDISKPDRVDREVNKRDAERKRKAKESIDKARHARETEEFNVGDKVLMKNLHKTNKLSTNYEQTPYTITKVYASSVRVENEAGDEYVRNKVHVKKYLVSTETVEKNNNSTPLPRDIDEVAEHNLSYWPLVVDIDGEEEEEIDEEEEEEILELSDLLEAFGLGHDDSFASANEEPEAGDLFNDDTIAYEDENALEGHRYPQRVRQPPHRLGDEE